MFCRLHDPKLHTNLKIYLNRKHRQSVSLWMCVYVCNCVNGCTWTIENRVPYCNRQTSGNGSKRAYTYDEIERKKNERLNIYILAHLQNCRIIIIIALVLLSTPTSLTIPFCSYTEIQSVGISHPHTIADRHVYCIYKTDNGKHSMHILNIHNFGLLLAIQNICQYHTSCRIIQELECYINTRT